MSLADTSHVRGQLVRISTTTTMGDKSVETLGSKIHFVLVAALILWAISLVQAIKNV